MAILIVSFFFSREKREKELNEFLKQRQNRLGLRIKQRIQSINDAMTSANQELKKKAEVPLKCLFMLALGCFG